MAALILVTNDDGIESPAMWRLAEGLCSLGEVVIVSPERDASGSSAALALKAPITCRRVQSFGRAYAIDAPPATCVWAGITALLDRRPDLVVSGINIGPNLGRDVLISGTVGAALFAGSQGIPAIAVSTDLNAAADWRAPVQAAVTAAGQLLQLKPPQPVVLNLNVPAGAEVRGAALTVPSDFTHLDMVKLDLRYQDELLHLVPTFKLRRPERILPGTDLAAYANGYASLSLLEPRPADDELIARVRRIAAEIGAPQIERAAGA